MATIEELQQKLDGIEAIRASGKLESATNGMVVEHQLIFAEMQIGMEIEAIKRAEEDKIASELAAAEANKKAEMSEEEKLKQAEEQKALDGMVANLNLGGYI